VTASFPFGANSRAGRAFLKSVPTDQYTITQQSVPIASQLDAALLDGAPRTESRFARAARRALDLAVALGVLLFFAPLLGLIVLAVRLNSRGRAVFRQTRVGLGGEEFLVNKFRSMRLDADPSRHRAYVQALIPNGNGSSNGNGAASPSNGDGAAHDASAADGTAAAPQNGLYKLVVDDRITPVGRFLRKTSLDELPQLWNVVRGEMSLVGPRPVIPYEVERYPDWYRERFAVKPGLTGLWQVSGRNETTYEEMVLLDIEYARRRTLRLDVGILARTVLVVLLRRGVA
jgi:lipopolysaccharide/colanic/teichoic acid biosynthesis glycosyltransferase